MKKLGFTLAEVLITLVIIGVIAAMTVPTLMNNTNAQEYRSALKKAISTMNQALTLHYALEGMTAGDYTDSQKLVNNVFRRRMSVIDSKSFSNVSESEGLASIEKASLYRDSDGKVQSKLTQPKSLTVTDADGKKAIDKPDSVVFTTADGMKFWVVDFKSDDNGGDDDEQTKICNSYNTIPCVEGAGADKEVTAPNLIIDVNGDRKPNLFTISSAKPRDIYAAMIYAQKVVPFGVAAQEVMFDKEVSTAAATQQNAPAAGGQS